jgi:hypothetical protein
MAEILEATSIFLHIIRKAAGEDDIFKKAGAYEKLESYSCCHGFGKEEGGIKRGYRW